MGAKKNVHQIFSPSLIIAILLFLALGLWVTKFSRLGMDLPISLYLQKIQNPVFNSVMKFVSWVGDSLLLEVIIGLTSLFLFGIGLKIQAVTAVMLTGIGAATGWVLKTVFSRPRPDPLLVDTYHDFIDKSFPSLHVLVYTIFFGYLLYLALLYTKNSFTKFLVALICSFMIISIGFSRIYLGAHWASDTIGGYLLGFIFINLAVKYVKR